MLCLKRKPDERIIVKTPDGTLITVMVCRVDPDGVRIGIDAPKEVAIHREEVFQRIEAGVSQ